MAAPVPSRDTDNNQQYFIDYRWSSDVLIYDNLQGPLTKVVIKHYFYVKSTLEH